MPYNKRTVHNFLCNYSNINTMIHELSKDVLALSTIIESEDKYNNIGSAKFSEVHSNNGSLIDLFNTLEYYNLRRDKLRKKINALICCKEIIDIEYDHLDSLKQRFFNMYYINHFDPQHNSLKFIANKIYISPRTARRYKNEFIEKLSSNDRFTVLLYII